MRWWLLPALALLLAPTVTPASQRGAGRRYRRLTDCEILPARWGDLPAHSCELRCPSGSMGTVTAAEELWI